MEPHVRPYHPNSGGEPRPRGPRANRRQPPPARKPGEDAGGTARPAPRAHAASKRGTKPEPRTEPKPRSRKTRAQGGEKRAKGATPVSANTAVPQVEAASELVSPNEAREARAPEAAEMAVALADSERADEETEISREETGDAVESPAERAEAGVGPVVGVIDFEDIFTRFQTPITNFVYRLVGNREQAYDLAQDVFVKAYRALAAGATIQAGALSSWLYRIASNTATDALRRRRLISWLPLSLFNDDRGVGAGMPGSDSGFGMPVPTDEHMVNAVGAFSASYDGGRFEQRVADREIVERVLKRLPEKYAACLLLYEHEGFSCAEIAEVLSVTPSAVKMRLMRARERFISLYQQELEGRR